MSRKGTGIGQAAPRQGLKFTRCKVCGFKICVNNYDDRVVRIFRRRGVVVCPWCRDGAIAHYLMTKKLAKASKEEFKELRKEAKQLLKKEFNP